MEEFLRRLVGDLEGHAHSFLKITAVTATYTILDTDELLGVVTSNPGFTLTLPLSADVGAGKVFIVKDASGTGAGTDNITIARSGTDTINDAASNQTITTDRGSLTLVADGVDDYYMV